MTECDSWAIIYMLFKEDRIKMDLRKGKKVPGLGLFLSTSVNYDKIFLYMNSKLDVLISNLLVLYNSCHPIRERWS